MAHLALVHPLKLAYVPVRKCGSTSITAAIQRAYGLQHGGRKIRDIMLDPNVLADLKTRGYEQFKLEFQDMVAQRKKYHEYHWVTSCRDPVDRTMSNYLNKVHSYAAKCRPMKNLLARTRFVMRGPFAWKDMSRLAADMHRLISPDEFAFGITTASQLIDGHYRLQVEDNFADKLQYDTILRMETFAQDYDALQNKLPNDSMILPDLPKENSSDHLRNRNFSFSSAAIKALSDHYRQDFETFSYAIPVV